MSKVARAKIQLPLLAIVAAAVGLIAARMMWPKLNFDTTSLILFGIAAVAWALAYVPLTKFKFGEFEAEFAPIVANVEQKVLVAEAAVTERAEQDGGMRPDSVDRGGPSGKGMDPATSAALREYRAIMETADSDRNKTLQVIALVERLAGELDLDPEVQNAAQSLRKLRKWVLLAGEEMTPQITAEALNLARRIFRLIVR